LELRISVRDNDYRFERLTHDIIQVFFETANELGYGLTENVYDAAMILSLTQAGFVVRREVPLPVWFRGHQIAMFRADAIVENTKTVICVNLRRSAANA
jgi:GxxExxY protein